jgi:hypothetical protein
MLSSRLLVITSKLAFCGVTGVSCSVWNYRPIAHCTLKLAMGCPSVSGHPSEQFWGVQTPLTPPGSPPMPFKYHACT